MSSNLQTLARATPTIDRTVTLTIWATPEQRAELDRLAHGLGQTRAQFLRECIGEGSRAAIQKLRDQQSA